MPMAFPVRFLSLCLLVVVGAVLLLIPAAQGVITGSNTNTTIAARAEVLGRVYCTASGNPEPSGSGGAAGATVGLRCDGNPNIVAPGVTTDASGFFQITVSTGPVLAAITNNITACHVVVDLPILSCGALTPVNGTFEAALTINGTVTSPFSGPVATFLTQPFKALPSTT